MRTRLFLLLALWVCIKGPDTINEMSQRDFDELAEQATRETDRELRYKNITREQLIDLLEDKNSIIRQYEDIDEKKKTGGVTKN